MPPSPAGLVVRAGVVGVAASASSSCRRSSDAVRRRRLAVGTCDGDGRRGDGDDGGPPRRLRSSSCVGRVARPRPSPARRPRPMRLRRPARPPPAPACPAPCGRLGRRPSGRRLSSRRARLSSDALVGVLVGRLVGWSCLGLGRLARTARRRGGRLGRLEQQQRGRWLVGRRLAAACRRSASGVGGRPSWRWSSWRRSSWPAAFLRGGLLRGGASASPASARPSAAGRRSATRPSWRRSSWRWPSWPPPSWRRPSWRPPSSPGRASRRVGTVVSADLAGLRVAGTVGSLRLGSVEHRCARPRPVEHVVRLGHCAVRRGTARDRVTGTQSFGGGDTLRVCVCERRCHLPRSPGQVCGESLSPTPAAASRSGDDHVLPGAGPSGGPARTSSGRCGPAGHGASNAASIAHRPPDRPYARAPAGRRPRRSSGSSGPWASRVSSGASPGVEAGDGGEPGAARRRVGRPAGVPQHQVEPYRPSPSARRHQRGHDGGPAVELAHALLGHPLHEHLVGAEERRRPRPTRPSRVGAGEVDPPVAALEQVGQRPAGRHDDLEHVEAVAAAPRRAPRGRRPGRRPRRARSRGTPPRWPTRSAPRRRRRCAGAG